MLCNNGRSWTSSGDQRNSAGRHSAPAPTIKPELQQATNFFFGAEAPSSPWSRILHNDQTSADCNVSGITVVKNSLIINSLWPSPYVGPMSRTIASASRVCPNSRRAAAMSFRSFAGVDRLDPISSSAKTCLFSLSFIIATRLTSIL